MAALNKTTVNRHPVTVVLRSKSSMLMMLSRSFNRKKSDIEIVLKNRNKKKLNKNLM